MLYEIANHFPDDMIYEKGGLHISLFQPTHRSFPDNKQDPILYRNLLREIERLLEEQFSKDAIHSIMKPFHEIERDKSFWNNTQDAIAILANLDRCIVYHLQTPVKELAMVADSFHIKPLIQAFQSLERYQLLGISRNGFKLFQGNRDGFAEIELGPDVPITMDEVLGKQLTDLYATYESHGGIGGSAIYRGEGEKSQEVDKDTEKYFRYIDRFIMENYSKPSKLPLILVSLSEYHAQFQQLSNNPYLMAEGIYHSYDSLNIEQLKNKAWQIIEPHNFMRIQKLLDAYENARTDALASSDLAQVAKAASEGRIETLLIEADRSIPGKIDHDTGDIHFAKDDHSGYDDILDDLAELVFKSKGEVVVWPRDKMPVASGVAGIFRYR